MTVNIYNNNNANHQMSKDLKKKFQKSFDLSQIAEDPMDCYLETLGLWKKRIARDGSCLFRAVAEQVSLISKFEQSIFCFIYISFKYKIDISMSIVSRTS